MFQIFTKKIKLIYCSLPGHPNLRLASWLHRPSKKTSQAKAQRHRNSQLQKFSFLNVSIPWPSSVFSANFGAIIWMLTGVLLPLSRQIKLEKDLMLDKLHLLWGSTSLIDALVWWPKSSHMLAMLQGHRTTSHSSVVSFLVTGYAS